MSPGPLRPWCLALKLAGNHAANSAPLVLASTPLSRSVWMWQVAAFLRLGLLQRAFETAAGAGSRADMRLVAAEAGRRADADVVALCTNYLSNTA